MPTELQPASEEDRPVVQNLARFYVYDMSELTGWPCPETGLFGGCDRFFEDWRDGNNEPFLIRVDGELAGFAGVKKMTDGDEAWYRIQEFFVLRKFRRRGVGTAVAGELFRMHSGKWQIRVLEQNAPAAAFWRAVVNEFAKGAFTETVETHPAWGAMHAIRFDSR